MPLSLFCVGGLYTHWDSVELICQWLSNRESFLVRDGAVSTSLGAGTPSDLEQGLCVLLSLREFICAAILCLEGLVLLDSSIPSASYSFSISSSTGFPEVWGERLAGDIPPMIYKWVLCFQTLEKVLRTMNFMANDNYIKFMFPCSWSYVGFQ